MSITSQNQKDSTDTWLLIHGAGGGCWQWQRWRNDLSARKVTAKAIDLQPAAGGLAETSLVDYQNQLETLQASQTFSVIVGASMGAVLAWQLSAKLTTKHVLVLVNPPAAPLAADPKHPPVIRWRGNQALASTRKHMLGASEADCYFAHSCWRDESGKALNEAQRWQPSKRSAPTLLVLGAEDPAAGSDRGQELSRKLDADRLIIDGAGHLQPLLCRSAATAVAKIDSWVKDQAI